MGTRSTGWTGVDGSEMDYTNWYGSNSIGSSTYYIVATNREGTMEWTRAPRTVWPHKGVLRLPANYASYPECTDEIQSTFLF